MRSGVIWIKFAHINAQANLLQRCPLALCKLPDLRHKFLGGYGDLVAYAAEHQPLKVAPTP